MPALFVVGVDVPEVEPVVLWVTEMEVVADVDAELVAVLVRELVALCDPVDDAELEAEIVADEVADECSDDVALDVALDVIVCVPDVDPVDEAEEDGDDACVKLTVLDALTDRVDV